GVSRRADLALALVFARGASACELLLATELAGCGDRLLADYRLDPGSLELARDDDGGRRAAAGVAGGVARLHERSSFGSEVAFGGGQKNAGRDAARRIAG